MDPSWFQAYVQRVRERRSLPSVESWVAAHSTQLPPTAVAGEHAAKPKPSAAGRAGAPRQTHSARNDLRTSPGVSGRMDLSFPPASAPPSSYNIFADIALHDQAASTIASASMTKSGLGEAGGIPVENFMVYLNDFLAPHWELTYSRQHEVHHESQNHNKFVDDLVDIVVEGLRAVTTSPEAAAEATDNVKRLARRLASQGSTSETLTLFSTFHMDRPNATGPVVYGIFYTTLRARYQQNGKTEIFSSSTITYSVLFRLINGVLIQHEQLYNRLVERSVNDWLDGHDL